MELKQHYRPSGHWNFPGSEMMWIGVFVKTTLPPFGALKHNIGGESWLALDDIQLKQHYRPSGHWNLFFEKNSLLLHPNGVKTTLPPFGALKHEVFPSQETGFPGVQLKQHYRPSGHWNGKGTSCSSSNSSALKQHYRPSGHWNVNGNTRTPDNKRLKQHYRPSGHWNSFF